MLTITIKINNIIKCKNNFHKQNNLPRKEVILCGNNEYPVLYIHIFSDYKF